MNFLNIYFALLLQLTPAQQGLWAASSIHGWEARAGDRADCLLLGIIKP